MVEKKGQKIRAGVSPPPFSGNAQKKTFFFREGFPNATLQSLPHNSFPNVMLGLHVEDGNDHLAPLLLSRVNWGEIHPEQDNKAGIKLTDIFDMDYF